MTRAVLPILMLFATALHPPFGNCQEAPLRRSAAAARDERQRDNAATMAPWLHAFKAKRELHVSPAGKSDGRSPTTPMSLERAVGAAEPGDLFWLREGNYDAGVVFLRRGGTKAAPVVFRGEPNKRVRVLGKISIEAPYNWIWGIELADPDNKAHGGGSGTFACAAPGVRLINNIVHDSHHCGIGGWNNGPDDVYYGNIVYKVGQHDAEGKRCYPIYTQNRFETNGWKYIVGNMFLDVRPDVGGPAYNFHAYTEGGYLSGFDVRQNIMSRGYFLIGGGNEPHHRNIVANNYFYDMPSVMLGFARPIQAEVRDNYLGRSLLDMRCFWGIGALGPFAKPLPNVYTRNTIVYPPKRHVEFRTRGYTKPVSEAKAGVDGTPIDPQDVFDENTYAGEFRANFHAGGKNLADLDLDGWRRATAAAGNAFDARSKTVPAPNEPYVAVLPNDYEPGRGHVAVYNWGKADAVAVDLSAVVPRGAAFKVVRAKDAFGESVAAGKYDDAVKLRMAGEEFAAFLVLSQAAR